MPPQRCLLEPWPHVDDGVGDRGFKGGLLCWCGVSCPGKGLARGTCFVPLLFVVLALALLLLSWVLVLPWLTSPVLLGVTVGAAPTARAQVLGYKIAPLFLYTDTSGTFPIHTWRSSSASMPWHRLSRQ